jgi:SAM-dependent methyltransferase
MTESRAHWDETYATKDETRVSWYQPSPEQSLALIKASGSPVAAVIDVGGGTSRLADALLADGYRDVTVLDISAVALERSKARLGDRADAITWIVADVTQWKPVRTWNVWHDRAVFHFLTDAASQDAYLEALKQGTAPGSAVIMATFALAGPERCSGLPVQRYSAASLAARLGADFRLYAEREVMHPTPFGTLQAFTYAALRRI